MNDPDYRERVARRAREQQMTSDVGNTAQPLDDGDPFEGKEPVPGLEHLGRAIVDENGIPSGSPANYEVTRGANNMQPLPPLSEIISAVAEEFKDFGQK